ncbi:MAG: hypothetical protein IT313_06130 [Anaerolineales bacterium]|nr:hypothetical protein [Anaerolineales bacterium]
MQRQRKAISKKMVADELENARWGYQAAISSVTSHQDTFWSIFNAMLVANSIVIAGIGFSNSELFKMFLSIIGGVLCFLWLLLSKRHREYVTYYLLSAREIEERYFPNTVKTFSRGGYFAHGKTVILEIGQSEQKRQMDPLSRLIRGEAVAYFVILVFELIYIGAFFI